MDDSLLTPSQTAEFLNISPRTLEAWRRKGIGPPFMSLSLRCVRYSERALNDWISARAMGLGVSGGSADEAES